MSDPFITPSPEPGPEKDVDAFFALQKQNASAMAIGALDANPDDAARANQLAQATGIHPALVDANLENVEKQHKATLTQELFNNNPKLQEYVNSHPLAAKLSNDDYAQLDKISDMLSRPKTLREHLQELPSIRPWWLSDQFMQDTFDVAKEGLKGIVESPTTFVGITGEDHREELRKSLSEQGLPVDEKSLRRVQARLERGEAMQGALFGVGQVALSPVFGAYRTYFSRPLEERTGFPKEASEGLAIAALGAVGVRSMHAEAVRPEKLKAAAEKAKAAAEAAEPFVKANVDPPVGIDPLIDEAHAAQAKEDLAQLKEVFGESQRSATRDRDPEMFAAFVKQHTESRIGISAEAVRNLYGEKSPHPDDGILGWVPDIGDQLRVAEATGGDISVPLGDWLAKADPGVAKDLHDHIRVRASGLTLEEAKDASKAIEPKADVVSEDIKISPTEWEGGTDAAIGTPIAKMAKKVLTIGDEPAAELNLIQNKDGSPYIQSIQTYPEFKRQGFATALMKDLEKEFPNQKFQTSAMTREGRAFFNALEGKKLEEVDSLRRAAALDPKLDTAPDLEQMFGGKTEGEFLDYGSGTFARVRDLSGGEQVIAEEAQKVFARIMPKGAKLNLVTDLRAQAGGRSRTVRGAYQQYEDVLPIIILALNGEGIAGFKPLQSLRHEGIHHLRGYNFFTEGEWGTLEAAAEKEGWLEKHNIDERYPHLDKAGKLEEAIAEEYSSRHGPRHGEEPLPKSELRSPLDKIFDKMKELFSALHEVVKKALGKEPTVDDLFEKVEKGEIGSREGGSPREPYAFDPKADLPEQGELDVTRLEDKDLFAKANAIGMTVKQYRKYLELIDKRDAEDTAYAAKKAEKEIAKRQTTEWKDASAKIRDEVKPDILNRPDVAADEFLRAGVLYGDKVKGRPRLDSSKLTAEQRALLPKDYYTEGGISPDDVAGLFGYQSGAALVERLAQLVKDRGELGPKEFINKLTEAEVERRMQAEHGDLAQNILEEAKDHVISQTQFDMLHEETLALANKAGLEMSLTQAQLRAAVKAEFGNLKIGELKTDKFLKNAGRAGTLAERAILEEKPKDAFKYKQQQYLSMLMANEAKALEKAQKSFARNAKTMSRREVPSVQQDYTNFIHDILSRVGQPIRRSVQDLAGTIAKGEWKNLQEFVEYKQGHDLREVPVADFLYDQNFKKEFGDLTADEFRAVHDSVKALMANGRDEKKITKAGEAADLAEVKGKLIDELKTFPERKRDITKNQPIRHALRTYLAAHLQIESLFNRWDRGDPQGNWTQYVMRDLSVAANSEAALERKYSRMVAAISDKVDVNEKINNTIFHDPFSFEVDPETGKKGPSENSVLLAMNRKNLRAVLLNAGNESNLKKLAQGYGLTPEQVMSWLHQTAKKEDWDWAQAMGDVFKELKKESDQMYWNLTDIEPESIDIQPVNTPHGQYDGWYYPIVYDPVWEGMSKKLLGGDALEQDNYVRATTPAGYTKSRTGYVAPVSLLLDQTPSRMKSIIHDIAFRPSIINASKIFYDKDVRAAIAKHYGVEYRDLLIPWLRDVANAGNFRSDAAKVGTQVSEFFRQNIIAALIGFNPGTVMKHGPTAAMNSITEVGPINFLRALKGLTEVNESTGENNWTFSMRESEELGRRHRHYIETLRGADEQLFQEKGIVGSAKALASGDIMPMRDTMIRLGSWPVAMSDLLSAVPTWLAKYESSMREGADHGTAVFDADRAVRRAHGSSVITNRPALMRGGPMAQWMSSLYGFFSHILNRQFELAWKAKDTLDIAKGGDLKEAMSRTPELGAMFFSYIIFPALIEELVTPMTNEDKESWGMKAAKGLAKGMSSSWIFGRDIANGILGGRDPTMGLLGTSGKTITDTLRDLRRGSQTFDKAHAGTLLMHFLTMLGGLTGLTNAQEGRVGKFIYNYSTGQERPKGFGDWWKGLRRGQMKEPRG